MADVTHTLVESLGKFILVRHTSTSFLSDSPFSASSMVLPPTIFQLVGEKGARGEKRTLVTEAMGPRAIFSLPIQIARAVTLYLSS